MMSILKNLFQIIIKIKIKTNTTYKKWVSTCVNLFYMKQFLAVNFNRNSESTRLVI